MSNSDFIAIILAAGKGTRLGAGRSKGLLELSSPEDLVIVRVLRTFSAESRIKEFVVTSSPDEIADFKNLKLAELLNRPVSIIEGGASRQESVKAALEFIERRGADEYGYVLVHDAARCLLSSALVQASVDGAIKHGAITTALPVIDSIKEVNAGKEVVCSLDRSKLWAVQTPQAFKFELLLKAHNQSTAPDATDDASLVEKIGKVHVVPGERTNFKVTTKEDLAYARFLLSSEQV